MDSITPEQEALEPPSPKKDSLLPSELGDKILKIISTAVNAIGKLLGLTEKHKKILFSAITAAVVSGCAEFGELREKGPQGLPEIVPGEKKTAPTQPGKKEESGGGLDEMLRREGFHPVESEELRRTASKPLNKVPEVRSKTITPSKPSERFDNVLFTSSDIDRFRVRLMGPDAPKFIVWNEIPAQANALARLKFSAEGGEKKLSIDEIIVLLSLELKFPKSDNLTISEVVSGYNRKCPSITVLEIQKALESCVYPRDVEDFLPGLRAAK